MTDRYVVLLSLSLALLVAAPSEAEMCTQDVVPAATLLVPYFEVDLSSVERATTLISINNAKPEPVLTHITMWTDWSQPTVDFDVFLTGYDVVTFNMRDVFNGNIPLTADDQSDPGDSISPHGINPEWDGDFTDCDGFFPFFSNPVINGDNLERVVDGHLGEDVLGNGCMGSNYGDNVARGYITIDSATRCSVEFPSDNGYFGGLNPVARDHNAIWGDFFLVHPLDRHSVGGPLVHIEADPEFDAEASPSGYTFYGRYTQADGGVDHREPLSGIWGVDYQLGPSASTELVVWRDVSNNSTDTFYTCGEGPPWTPLQTARVACFDDEENVSETCTDGECLPLATQRTALGTGDLAIPYDAGWCWIDLAASDDGPGDVDYPGDSAQGWVGTITTLDGFYSGGLSAVELRSTCELPTNLGLPLDFLFIDGFESADTSGWSR